MARIQTKYGRSGFTKVKVVIKMNKRIGYSIACYKKGLFSSTYKYCNNKSSMKALYDAQRFSAGKYYEKHCC